MDESPHYITSNLLTAVGVKHGWFMRYGGVSTGLFESLNGKKGSGDGDVHVLHNRGIACQKLFSAAPSEEKDLAHIIHEFKDRVLEVTSAGEFQGYDASISMSSEVVLSQTTADCGSIIISDTTGSVVALVHGSWHTLAADIICKTVAKMKVHTTGELVAGIGPMICKKCYEFGPEAAELFKAHYLEPKNDTYHVDLKAIVIDQLHQSGVLKIDDVAICTKEDKRFFSHRRDGARSGRFLTLAKAK